MPIMPIIGLFVVFVSGLAIGRNDTVTHVDKFVKCEKNYIFVTKDALISSDIQEKDGELLTLAELKDLEKGDKK